MKALLEYPKELGMPDAVIEVEAAPDGRMPKDELRFPYSCGACDGQHYAVYQFSRYRLHDDGTLKVYSFVGIE